jgi:hypothetical protein
MGYVETGVAGQTELRIHGVSGTPPEDTLGHPHARRVTGDADAGIYRRVWERRDHAEDVEKDHLEAYSWGGLTSGSWKRALWLLLLPFMLLNVAYFMALRVPPDSIPGNRIGEATGARRQRRVSEGAQRILAISMTVTLVLAAVTVAMDLAGWQCSRDAAHCQGLAPGLLDQPTLDTAGRRLAASSLMPIALIGLLWLLGHKTWRLAESFEVRGATAHNPELWATPLEDRALWNGQIPVARLRALHVAAALSTVAIFLSVPFVAHPQASLVALIKGGWNDEGRRWPGGLLLASLAVLAVSVILTGLPRYDRERPAPRALQPYGGSPPGSGAHRVKESWLAYIACLLVALGIVTAWRGEPGGDLSRHHATNAANTAEQDFDLIGQLPWLDDMTSVTFLLQAAALAGIFVICWRQYSGWTATQPELPWTPTEDLGKPENITVAWKGLAQFIFALLAWVLVGGLSAAVIWRSAAVFGNPQGPGQGRGHNADAPLYLGEQFFWAALAALVLAAVTLVVVLVARCRLKAARAKARPQVEHAYAHQLQAASVRSEAAVQDAAARVEEISGIWAAASISRVLKKAMTVLTIAMIVVVAIGLVGFLRYRDWPLTGLPRQAVTAGGFVLTGAVLALLYVGHQAYQNPKFRRSVGIAWDLGTFWPRATHPLAPPCYAERTVPDLLGRVEYIHANEGRVTLSAHSQGTVIAAAVIAAMRTPCARNVGLITYGSPLRRLYAQYFPAYFGIRALLRIGELLEPDAAGQDGSWTRRCRERWPWLNLYRLSDPIGGQIFVDYDATESSGLIRDHWAEQDPSRPDVAGSPAELAGEIRARRMLMKEVDGSDYRLPETFENDDVDWQLVDPPFAKRNGDGLWPHADGHSRYQGDPAFPIALAVVRERRGPYVPEA